MNKCICDLKNQEEKTIERGHFQDICIYLTDGEYYLKAVSDGIATLKLNYCPKCGRKLVE